MSSERELSTIKIVIDLDNTLLDATTTHLKYYNQASGLNFTNEDVNDFYIYRLYNWDRETRETIYNQYGYNIHWESNPYPKSIDTLNQLAEQHQITLMTARPPHFELVTSEWLAHYKVKYHELIFTENKFQEFLNLEADILVDDAPHYAIEFSKNRRKVILFHQPYNRLLKNDYIYRAMNWCEVKTHIDILTDQKMLNQS